MKPKPKTKSEVYNLLFAMGFRLAKVANHIKNSQYEDAKVELIILTKYDSRSLGKIIDSLQVKKTRTKG